MSVRFLLLLVAVILPAGCTSVPQVKVPERVYVNTPVACVDPADRPARPELRRIEDLLKMDRYTRTLAAWSDLVKYEAYTAELEAVVAGCSRITTAPGNPPAH